jgi:hypothetical protein
VRWDALAEPGKRLDTASLAGGDEASQHRRRYRLMTRLYAVEERAKALSLSAEQRLALRQRVSARLLGKLYQTVCAGVAAVGSAEESVRRRGARQVGSSDSNALKKCRRAYIQHPTYVMPRSDLKNAS